ncbi:DUF6268 family outer membrane beta-barrel protein [Bremerella sp. T1]|uniref:DUF6268 family outer membrane beta-barrel protein n=1 Tax=Bremerella sp. TYQ1 TaxID=3119568 RepID=UPI001CCCBD86|nr:DUF6268 family outer membrane beta-barrel protein [Bremerella volcania]UBM34975.1 DUF6268 family outer membrane beta-barrel protein [Bremerella volcania]
MKQLSFAAALMLAWGCFSGEEIVPRAMAQMQPWAQRGLSTIERESPYRPIERIPPTEVFPGGYKLPDYPKTGSPGNPAVPATLVSENPPELSTLSEDVEELDALYLTEDEVFTSRPKLSPAKNGILQSLTIQSTWIAGSGDNIGMTEVSGSATLGFPAPTRESPLLLTPGYGMYFLVGPDSVQAPATLYQAYLTTRWMSQLSPKWGTVLSVTPGVYSDFQRTDSDAFRVSGMALMSYQWTETVQFLFGVVYLNRDDYSILPAVGLIWTPDDDHRLELTFPRPRYMQLFSYGDGYEDWWYVSGEFGGGTWSVEHPKGMNDSLTLSDYRIIAGMERKSDGGGKSFVEIGYVFGRKFEYKDDPVELDMSDTIMLRSGWWY